MKFYKYIQMITIVFMLGATQTLASPLDVSCIGPDNATGFLIYLHGMDSNSPSPQELQNRKILNDLASKYNLKIALPRAQMECPTQPGSICWGWSWNSSELTNIIPQILESREKCFPSDQTFGVIGFSNGGYLINHWFQSGLFTDSKAIPRFFISSGADRGFVQSTTVELSKNPPLVLIAGDHDVYNHDLSEAYVNVVTFSGGHELNEDSLSDTLKNFLKK